MVLILCGVFMYVHRLTTRKCSHSLRQYSMLTTGQTINGKKLTNS